MGQAEGQILKLDLAVSYPYAANEASARRSELSDVGVLMLNFTVIIARWIVNPIFRVSLVLVMSVGTFVVR